MLFGLFVGAVCTVIAGRYCWLKGYEKGRVDGHKAGYDHGAAASIHAHQKAIFEHAQRRRIPHKAKSVVEKTEEVDLWIG
jgi:hypothetical protein